MNYYIGEGMTLPFNSLDDYDNEHDIMEDDCDENELEACDYDDD